MRWTREEDKIILCWYKKIPSHKIEEFLVDKKAHNIRQRAKELGIAKKGPRKWTQEEDKLLKELYPSSPAQELEIRFNRSVNGIRWRAEKLGIQKDSYWTPEDDEKLLKLYPILSIKEITRIFEGRSWQSVRLRAERLIHKRGLDLKLPRNTVNHQFFSSPNITNSYWAGFITGDGNVYNNQIKVMISRKDEDHLYRFKEACAFSGQIRRFDRQSDKGGLGQFCDMCVSSAQWKQDLEEKFNVIPNKTFLTKFPYSLNKACEKAFVIGLIDSDGGIYNYGYLSLLILGTEALLKPVEARFNNWYPYRYKQYSKVRKADKIYEYRVAGKRAKLILEDLKQILVPKLERKWSKVC